MILKTSVEVHGGHRFLHWHIHRPERLNAIGTSLAGELKSGLDKLLNVPPTDIRALILSAETVVNSGRATWIAGGDLTELAAISDRQGALHYAQTMHSFCRGLESLPFPVVAMIDGAAIGGGVELALAADIRIATARSTLEFRQLRLGLATGYGAASRLIDLVGKAKAQRLLYFCESLTAEDALGEALVHRILPSVSDLPQLLHDLAALAPEALAGQKKMFHLASTMPPGDTTWADKLFADLWRNPTHANNLKKFQDRTPSVTKR